MKARRSAWTHEMTLQTSTFGGPQKVKRPWKHRLGGYDAAADRKEWVARLRAAAEGPDPNAPLFPEADPVRDSTPRTTSARRDPYVDWKPGPDHDRGQEWRDEAAEDLMEAIVALPDRATAERFFRDLCTLRELDEMAQRWRVVQLLDAGWHYLEISRETGVSTATVTRIAQWLRHGTGGYTEALQRGAGTGTGTRARVSPDNAK
jgi:TrpR-related protein YerC/YecD